MDRQITDRHLKQNKEIIRVNQVQSNRIVALENEVTKLLSENISLRTQVIQLTHKQDLSSQKAQIERKLRELQRLVRTLGDGATTISSPTTAVLRKSPQKTDLLSLTTDGSPEASRSNFISSRSRPRSLAAPGRIIRTQSAEPVPLSSEMGEPVQADDEVIESIPCSAGSQEMSIERVSREAMDRCQAREERRKSRRISRTSDEIIPLPPSAMSDCKEELRRINSPSRQESLSPVKAARSERRRSRSSMTLERAPLRSISSACTTPRKSRTIQTSDDDDKENNPAERRSTASIRLLHSSPVKSRTALDVIADPLPSKNIQAQIQAPGKPLNEVAEIKSEPSSPTVEPATLPMEMPRDESIEEPTGRSRRAKTVNYAEPSLRHKMRRTETLPGDKRRKSTYRRSSSTVMDEARRSSAAHQTITIDED